MQGLLQKASSDIRKNAFKRSFTVNIEADFMWLILKLPLIKIQNMKAKAQNS